MRIVSLACLLTLVVSACSSAEQQTPATSSAPTSNLQSLYEQARLLALRQPASAAIPLGLALGMDSSQVQQRLDLLTRQQRLFWQASSHRVPIVLAEPAYVQQRLVRLHLVLKGNGFTAGAQHRQLLAELTRAYGGPGFEHSPGDEGGVRSWFQQGTEIELFTASGIGFSITYTSLPDLHALTQQLLQRDSLEIVQSKQATGSLLIY